jgi:hypothetical protein
MKSYRFARAPHELAEPAQVEEYRGFKLLLLNKKHAWGKDEILVVMYEDLPVADFWDDKPTSEVFAECREWLDRSLDAHSPEYVIAREEIQRLAILHNITYTEADLEKEIKTLFERASTVGLKQAIQELNHDKWFMHKTLGIEPTTEQAQSQIGTYLAESEEIKSTKAILDSSNTNNLVKDLVSLQITATLLPVAASIVLILARYHDKMIGFIKSLI